MMNDINKKVRKCKLCGKTIVGHNWIGICKGCKKKIFDKGITLAGLSVLFAGTFKFGTNVFNEKK